MRKIACMLLCILLLLSSCSSKTDTAMPYDLGMRYLENGEYDEAVLAFQAVIKIDPKNAAAYIGMADAYVQAGDLDKAIQVLQDAQDVVSDPDAIQEKLDELEKMKDPDAEYYRFIHDSLLPEYGYADDQQKTMRVTYEDVEVVVDHFDLDKRDGLLGADIADLNADGVNDLIVYRLEHQKNTGFLVDNIFLMSQAYIKNENKEFSLVGTTILGSTTGYDDYQLSVSLLSLESGAVLYTEDSYSSIFALDYNSSYRLHKLSENKKWIQKYSIESSIRGTGIDAYSFWTYEDDGSRKEAILWGGNSFYQYNDRNEEALTPPGTDFDDALSLGLEMMGIPRPDCPPSITFEVTSDDNSDEDNFLIMVSITPTDYTHFKERMNQYT